MRHPSVIAHCDWGLSKKKRWMATAMRRGQCWRIESPALVRDTELLIDRLRAKATEPGALLVGLDFPIGVPVHLAHGWA